MGSVTVGKNIVLYLINSLSASVPVGEATQVTRKAQRETKETSDSTTGRYKKYIAGMIDQSFSVTGLIGFSNGSYYDSTDLYAKMVEIGTNLVNFEYKEDNGTFVYTYSGQCLISSFQESSGYDDIGGYDVELQVVGEITVVQTGTMLPYYWLTSSSALTADQVVALIEAGGSTSVTAPSYSTITINWGAPGGKWLYFAIPAISPNRLSYYVSMGDQGSIGQPGDLFNFDPKSITIGSGPAISYKVYQSNVSKVNNSPMDLRTFYPTTGGIMGYGTTIYDKQTSTDGVDTITFPLLVGVQLNKLIMVLNGTQAATNILASPAVPTGADVSYDATTGTFTFPSGLLVGNDVTCVWLT